MNDSDIPIIKNAKERAIEEKQKKFTNKLTEVIHGVTKSFLALYQQLEVEQTGEININLEGENRTYEVRRIT